MVTKEFKPKLNNPFYFLRTGLYNKIKEHSHFMKDRVMDFGCGKKPYQSLFTNAQEYIGVDYEGEGHSHKNEMIDVFYDGKKIPFADNSFDNIFCSEVLEHIFNPDEIIAELNRVLKPGGKILLTCPFVWGEHEIPVDYARYTRFALKYLMEKHGFNIVLLEKSGDYRSTLYQMRIVYVTSHFIPSIPVLGKMKVFVTNINPVISFLMNSWFLCWHAILPKRYDWYQNNIVVAQKNL